MIRKHIIFTGSVQGVGFRYRARHAAELYGLDVSRNCMVRCLFHDDNNPSVKLNDDYFFFGFSCGERGDVIDLTAALCGLNKYDATRKRAQDFGGGGDYTSEKDLRQQKSAFSPFDSQYPIAF